MLLTTKNHLFENQMGKISWMENLICCETGKIQHSSKSEAKLHAKSLKRLRNYQGAPYQCRFCGAWHVGRDRNLQLG